MKTLPAIRVKQWLDTWNQVDFDSESFRKQPSDHFYIFSMKARDLRRLSAIYRRKTDGGQRRAEDLGIQRRHDPVRSQKIREFVRHGYPYCDLKESNRISGEHESLRKPGWLPTGIVINILDATDIRLGCKVAENDLISVSESNSGYAEIIFPKDYGNGWEPTSIAPVEVIDGQHRLWAFDDDEAFAPDFEMPVIAFHGLDISWQAYLFWSINVSPVRINASLAFDMYPLLRAEDWLDKAVGHKVYKEARAQELVESLWTHPRSPWRNKINMLAEPGHPFVRQAAWIRTLMAAFIKPLDVKSRVGGLFGPVKNQKKDILSWNRVQQCAFLVSFGEYLNKAIGMCKEPWVESLRKTQTQDLIDDYEAGMFSKHSLLNTDQGVRAVCLVLNDLVAFQCEAWGTFDWRPSDDANTYSDEAVGLEIDVLNALHLGKKIAQLANLLALFDWRTSAADGLSPDEQLQRKLYRGSGGYVELRNKLLEHLRSASADLHDADDIGAAARALLGQ